MRFRQSRDLPKVPDLRKVPMMSSHLQIILIRQLWKRSMRLGLIPVRHRGNVVLKREIPSARSPAKGLDRDLQVLLEPNRVHDMPTIQAKALLRTVKPVGPNNLMKSRVRR